MLHVGHYRWIFEPFINQSWTSTGSVLFGRLPKSPYCTKITRSFFKVLTHLLFREWSFSKVFHCINAEWNLLPWDYHCVSCTRERLNELLYSGSNSEFELTFQSFHLNVYCHAHWKKKTNKLEVDLNQDGLSQLQDLGLNCLPLLPQYRVTAYSKFQ